MRKKPNHHVKYRQPKGYYEQERDERFMGRHERFRKLAHDLAMSS